MNADALTELLLQQKWIAAAAVVIGIVVRLLKDGRLTLPLTVPARWRPALALGLGVVSGVLEAVVAGTDWPAALVGGLVSAALAGLGHGVLVEGLLAGNELRAKKGGGK